LGEQAGREQGGCWLKILVPELSAELALGHGTFCKPKWRREGKNLAQDQPESAVKFPSQGVSSSKALAAD